MIYLVTGNKHKFQEISKILAPFGIKVKQYKGEKKEGFEASIKENAEFNAKYFAKKLNKPVIVDDSGLEFSAYKGFPEQNPKWIYETIGYNGIMRLLKGKNRKAVFKCAASYCEPNKKPKTIIGRLKGKISENIYCKNKDVMPYERIFIPEKHNVVLAKLTREQKNEISHRAQAFTKLGGKI